MARKTLSRPHRKVCVGDLNKRVVLSERKIVEPGFGQTNFGESFPDARETWARVATVNGRTIFNGVDADVSITHEIAIRFDSKVTSETWVQLKDGTRLDVHDTNNLDERDEFIILLCAARGTKEASKTSN